MYQFHTARKGVSAAQLARELGITPASAWFMMHRLREAMDPGIEPLSGVIEVDEAFVGGLEKNKHSKKKLHKNWIEGKQIVLGMRERDDGRIVLRPIHSGKKAAVVDEIRFTIQPGSTIYSDEGNSFASLELWYSHETVTHQRGEYVRELVTTNSYRERMGHCETRPQRRISPMVKETRRPLPERSGVPFDRRQHPNPHQGENSEAGT